MTMSKIYDNGVYREMTAEEIAAQEAINAKMFHRSEIEYLKSLLRDTDYKAIKYAEGQLSEDEYTETKAQRQVWRNQINELEAQLSATTS